MTEIKKYPRTQHIRGSRFQHGDHDMEDVSWEQLCGKHLVIEEKIDGANCGISFSEDCEFLLQSRGHFLRGGPRERHFDLLKQWAACHQDHLFGLLGTRYIMYGEWMFAKHTYFYDALPHYFMEFDVFDTHEQVFLSTHERGKLLEHSTTSWNRICPVLVVAEGKFNSVDALRALITRSNFITPTSRLKNLEVAATAAGVSVAEAIQHTDPSQNMEGLYIKWEENGAVKGRYKFVRDTFTNSILEQETHWHDRPIIQNALIPGAFEKMFV